MKSALAKVSMALIALVLGLGPALAPAWAGRSERTTAVVRVVKEVAPSVVNISTKSRQRARLFSTGDEMLDQLFNQFMGPMEREETSLGSGVIIDGKRGLIATNSHVVSRATQIEVQLADNRRFTAKVVGADPESDLAVLRIETDQALPQVLLGDSGDLMIGEDVIAIGNPYGLSHTVTVGVVSALQRRVPLGRDRWLHDVIQTDASINPGNSGGPLLNVDGEVVGINTAIHRDAQGIGFAIPINRVQRVVDDLVRYGEVVPAWLGITPQDLDQRLARHFGLTQPRGALVLDVMPDSPAAGAGVKRGELMVAANGKTLEDASHFRGWVSNLSAGQKVTLTFKGPKGSVKRSFEVKAFPMERAQEVAWRRLGFGVRPVDKANARANRVRPGSALMIDRLRPNSRAAQIGLKPGDLVRQVGDTATPDLESFNKQIAKHRLLRRITVLIQRGPYSQFVTLGG